MIRSIPCDVGRCVSDFSRVAWSVECFDQPIAGGLGTDQPRATRALGRGSRGVPSGRRRFPRPTGEITRGRGGYLLDGREDPVGRCLRVAALRFILRSSGLFQP
jgi:hypothetical protein